jgi:hypothetical protein
LPRWYGHQWYFQDDWKPARGLTVNLGLRWSYESPYQTKYGQQSQFDPTVRDPLTGNLGAITHPASALAKKDLNNFAPRVGMAWSFKPNWLFRGSFGMIHQDIQATQTYINNDEYLATATLQSPVGDPRPIFRLADLPSFGWSAELPVQCEPGRVGSFRRHELFVWKRKLVRPEHAHAVCDELARWPPVGVPE